MPAVTPAELQTEPSRTKIGSDSTRTAGKRRANSAQYDQWVTARRPSSAPEAANRNAPVQTDATRRALLARARTQSTSAVSALAASTPGPPAIINVSGGIPLRGSGRVPIPTPAEVVTPPSSFATTR